MGLPLNRYNLAGTAFNRLLAEMPYLSRCSNNKTAALVRPREYAVRQPYIQVNRRDRVSWLVFDLDHSNSLIWEDQNFPAPNFVVSNRKNGHCHLFYAISPVCTSEKARSKPIQYMKAVYEAMSERLNADPAYSGPVAKTPGHPWWSTWEIHGAEYELGELADSVDLNTKSPWGKKPNLDSVSDSRHCMLFEELRFYAYSIVSKVKERGTFQSFVRLLEAYAHSKNNYQQRGHAMNLRSSQVQATVKSVARWTWDRYRGCQRYNRGVMKLDKSCSLRERQQQAAQRTHKHRQASTESKIKHACRALSKQGLKLTQSAIACAAKLTRQTVAKYRYIFEEFHDHDQHEDVLPLTTLENSNVVDLAGVGGLVDCVKYAVHQISAVRLRFESDDSESGSPPV